MTEEEAKRIAIEFVARSVSHARTIDSIRFFPRSSYPVELEKDEWVAIFDPVLPDDVLVSTEFTMAIVDDVTREARFFETF